MGGKAGNCREAEFKKGRYGKGLPNQDKNAIQSYLRNVENLEETKSRAKNF